MPVNNRLPPFFRSNFVVLVLLLASGLQPAVAWGPHPTITQTALNTLGTNHPLHRTLGEFALRLTNYCWMADYKRIPFRDGDEYFYADDYLLFPQAPVHWDHICPEVRKTFRPYFRRALQALRMENPANAARWVGSLLHFQEDTGSPPHAAEIRGLVHRNMENWVDAEQITIAGYQPRRLGTNDADAENGFVRRMDGLIAFSRERGLRLKTPVLIGNKSAVKPAVLECALETARVTADLLHTLGELAGTGVEATTSIAGTIESNPSAELAKFPARIILRGTNISTVADLSGGFQLRGVPPGRHELWAFRPGCTATQAVVEVTSGHATSVRLSLGSKPGNLIRNGDFALRWVRPDAPDCWYRTDLGWEGEIIPLERGQRYRLTTRFKAGASHDVLLRWTRMLPHEVPGGGTPPRIDSKPITPANPVLEFVGTENMALIQVTLRSPASVPPGMVCDGIELIRVEAAK